MIRTALALLVLSSTAILTSGTYIGQNPYGIEIHKIDLNLDPKDRFRDVAHHFKEPATAALNFYVNYLPGPAWWVLENFLDMVHFELSDYFQEVVGMAEAMDIKTNILLIMQFVYELSAFCTSNIVADTNGTVTHVRNLDFLNADVMRSITYEGWFYRGDQLIFKSIMFAGLNGVMTGIKPGNFSISLNQRNPSVRTDPFALGFNLISLATFQEPPVMRVIRETL
jgi:hypothetical protein